MPDYAHRIGEVTVTVPGPDGRPLAGHTVTVAQQRHAFAFGNIGFDFVALVGGPPPEASGPAFGGSADLGLDRLSELWLNLFNTATLPFYWGPYEPRRGTTDVDRLTRTARWLAERGVTVKGHPLVWHTVQPPWLLGLDIDEVERLQRERIRALAGGFAGLIDRWDAINEAVTTPSPGWPGPAAGSPWCGWRSRRPARPTPRPSWCSTTSTSPRRTNA
jgi:endo-1,4-beta-xylanase